MHQERIEELTQETMDYANSGQVAELGLGMQLLKFYPEYCFLDSGGTAKLPCSRIIQFVNETAVSITAGEITTEMVVGAIIHHARRTREGCSGPIPGTALVEPVNGMVCGTDHTLISSAIN